jgi:hypothetical protein
VLNLPPLLLLPLLLPGNLLPQLLSLPRKNK